MAYIYPINNAVRWLLQFQFLPFIAIRSHRLNDGRKVEMDIKSNCAWSVLFINHLRILGWGAKCDIVVENMEIIGQSDCVCNIKVFSECALLPSWHFLQRDVILVKNMLTHGHGQFWTMFITKQILHGWLTLCLRN